MLNILWDLLQQSNLSSHSEELGHAKESLADHNLMIKNLSKKIDELQEKFVLQQQIIFVLAQLIIENIGADEEEISSRLAEITGSSLKDIHSAAYCTCIYCGKTILKSSDKCIFCGEFNPHSIIDD
ncbi:MAG: hypothetical protein RBR08_00080 [Desulforegulaceae bacterium]|nr:hypothetical protein [Desulforegulaceae bacterium]